MLSAEHTAICETRMKMKKILFIALCALASQAQAGDFDQLQNLASQSEFRALSEDLGAAMDYKGLVPAEPLGITGFDVGVEATATELKNSHIVDTATGGAISDTLLVPKVHVHKGLPFGLDVGAFYGTLDSSKGDLIGAELRYALLEGGVAEPAVAVRASYTRLDGVSQLALETKGLDLMISKGFGPMTPFGGIGRRWVDSHPDASTGWNDESFSLDKAFAGVNFNFVLLNLAFEADKTGSDVSYGAKIGLRF